ncbi:hypothetical protein JAAARDRAFT_195047 [Jaapia argillacea MUCL 33604]|uniref:Uncharacterized protein n=1 Tax=Jaapia argillacea MUCL 33604 TaxID=933084 RepID=A0A067PYQ0_9AGAM|nr:hypothetical protein JAAARDRAFT_195047 [Jaapia argillacea MUCL 33604]
MWSVVALLLFCNLWLACRAQNVSSLNFYVSSGGNDNYFLRDNLTTAQILLTSTNTTVGGPRRFVAALPAGNSGALVYFLPSSPVNSSSTTGASQNTTLTVGMINGTMKGVTEDYDNVGVQADLTFNENATLGVTIIGAVRAMRDYVEGSGTMHEIFNYTLYSYNTTNIRLHRQYINTTNSSSSIYKGADLYLIAGSGTKFSVTPGNNGTYTPPTIDILVPSGSQNGTVRVKVVTNETSLAGLNPQSLFLNQSSGSTPGIQLALNGLADGSNPVADQVSFLTYSNKFTAGGWRFLTYFGRDSLIALRLLMPTLTSEAIEAALGAVIERANSTGALCHEETIGDYASFVNMGNNMSYLGNQPYYDYKMIDTDLYLLPALSHYFLELPQGKGRAAQFLARNATLQNGTYGQILNRTIEYNFARSLPFYVNSTPQNLLAFRPGQPVGNWRDSNEGTGYGPVPFDVNTALVPASLRATDALAQAGIIPTVTSWPGGNISDVAAVWEREAPVLFEVTIDSSTAQARLQNFVKAANLSTSLLSQNSTTSSGNVSFYALSLMADGSPVEVLNSDLSFNLLYGTNVSQEFLQHVVDALQPYPRGLLTNIGMLVANPAYDSNTTNIEVLNRAAYHGTVVWSFQQGLMAGGLLRQLGFCSPITTVDINPPPQPPPSWCSNTTFVQALRDAQMRLWTSINGAKSQIYSEVWSYSFNNATNDFSVADLGSLSPEGTESDAIQLWSYGFLGILDPYTIP